MVTRSDGAGVTVGKQVLRCAQHDNGESEMTIRRVIRI
jgi:hypothetical protein